MCQTSSVISKIIIIHLKENKYIKKYVNKKLKCVCSPKNIAREIFIYFTTHMEEEHRRKISDDDLTALY